MYTACLTISFLAAILDVLLAAAEWPAVLLPIAGFYFCMRLRPWRVFPILLVLCALCDAVWGHALPTRCLAFGLLYLAVLPWRKYGELHSWLSLLLAAPAVALCLLLPQWLRFAFQPHAAVTPAEFARFSLWQLLAILFLLPPLCMLWNLLVPRARPSWEEERDTT